MFSAIHTLWIADNMNFVDFALVRLAQDATRASVFDQLSLAQIATAAYAPDVASLDGPYTALFDEFQMGVPIPRRANVDGYWGSLTGMERTEVRLAVAGLGRASTVRVDALWRGSVVARTAPANSQVNQVRSAAPEWTVPADSVKLPVQVAFADPAATPPSPTPLPLTAAILVRDTPLSLADLLAESKTIREHLLEAGVERPRDPSMSRRAPLVVVWIVPSSVFDDADWPGTDAADRRRTAAGWLGVEGIAVATLSR